MASVATLFLLSSNQAKAHALKKYTWLRWLRDNRVGEAPMELEAVKETEVEDVTVDEVASEEVAVQEDESA